MPALEFSAAVRTSFERAAAASGMVCRDYRIGPYLLRVRFAGGAMIPRLTPALDHLAVRSGDGPADLTVCAWDTVSTLEPLPPPAWSREAYGARAEIIGFNTDRIRTVYHLESSVLSLLDVQTSLGFYWTRDAATFPMHKIAAPLISILHWWFQPRGYQMVHAGALGRDGRAVLLAGRSGLGKSTTALACLDSPLLYLSDDYCLIAADPEPRVQSLFSCAKVTPEGLARLPFLRDVIHHEAGEPGEKLLLFLHPHFERNIGRSSRLHAVLIPRVTAGTDTRPVPVSAVTALRALAPSTICQLAGADEGAMQIMSAVVRQLPCYELQLGSDLAQIPDVISSLLDEVHH